jgi:hypothetical protein
MTHHKRNSVTAAWRNHRTVARQLIKATHLGGTSMKQLILVVRARRSLLFDLAKVEYWKLLTLTKCKILKIATIYKYVSLEFTLPIQVQRSYEVLA